MAPNSKFFRGYFFAKNSFKKLLEKESGFSILENLKFRFRNNSKLNYNLSTISEHYGNLKRKEKQTDRQTYNQTNKQTNKRS